MCFDYTYEQYLYVYLHYIVHVFESVHSMKNRRNLFRLKNVWFAFQDFSKIISKLTKSKIKRKCSKFWTVFGKFIRFPGQLIT